MRRFFTALSIQLRVILALSFREIYLRHGRQNLGFAWVFAEPMMFVFPVLTMWHYLRPRYADPGVLWADISWSGYLPLMLYRHLGSMALHSIRSRAGLFYHRRITTYDIVASQIFVEVISNVTAAAFSLFVLSAIGEVHPPEDWPMLYVGYFFMIWWCASLSILIGGLSEYSDWVEKIWMPTGYMYIAVGGCFYLANFLPPNVRRIALLQPSLQAYEMIRCGMFGTHIPTYYDFTYTTIVLSIITLVGLATLRGARKFVILQ